GQARIALRFVELRQLAHCGVEGRQVALLLGEQGTKRGHELRVTRDRSEERIVRSAREQAVVAGKTAPRGPERAVFVLQRLEQAPFSRALFLRLERPIIER